MGVPLRVGLSATSPRGAPFRYATLRTTAGFPLLSLTHRLINFNLLHHFSTGGQCLLIMPNRTQMTLMTLIYADKTNKICLNPRHPRHLRSPKTFV
ncbi:MAG: hypothetical protein LBB41_06805 [Prevotellaceae bacterium]|nr:hypothetical protein [Prevotellaceae bacterium]